MPEQRAVIRALPKPKGLGERGARIWKQFTSSYVFRLDELLLLEEAAKIADQIALLDAGMLGQPLVVKGSMGQEREHPLLSEVRQQRMALSRLLGQLDLPEPDSLTADQRAGQRSAHARAMASARWAKRGAS